MAKSAKLRSAVKEPHSKLLSAIDRNDLLSVRRFVRQLRQLGWPPQRLKADGLLTDDQVDYMETKQLLEK